MKSWVEIDGSRLQGNLRAVQAAVGESVEVLAVIKANGYGHDAALVAPLLVAGGAMWLGVTDVDEGVLVRSALDAAGILAGTHLKSEIWGTRLFTPSGNKNAARVLVMCGMETPDAAAMVEHALTPVVWTVEHIAAMETAAAAAATPTAVHLEIDTGMARQGAAVGDDLAAVLARLATSAWVHCEGVMSHLSSAEVHESAITAAQCERFAAALEQVKAAGLQPKLVHLGNTSAVDEASTLTWIRAAAARLGARAMVRTGLALYGDCLPVERGAGRLRPQLLPAMTWKTRVAGVRTIEAGTTVGYGATYVAAEPMRLALLPVGYADGFRREASSGLGDGWVMLRGQRAAVVGRVSMNLTVVDVTAIAGVAIGEEVVLLGEHVTADDHALWCGTIPYEILCGVKGQVDLR